MIAPRPDREPLPLASPSPPARPARPLRLARGSIAPPVGDLGGLAVSALAPATPRQWGPIEPVALATARERGALPIVLGLAAIAAALLAALVA